MLDELLVWGLFLAFLLVFFRGILRQKNRRPAPKDRAAKN